MACKRYIGAHLRIVEFVLALEQSHQTKWNSQSADCVPYADEMNLACPMAVVAAKFYFIVTIGMILLRGALVDIPGLGDAIRVHPL